MYVLLKAETLMQLCNAAHVSLCLHGCLYAYLTKIV